MVEPPPVARGQPEGLIKGTLPVPAVGAVMALALEASCSPD